MFSSTPLPLSPSLSSAAPSLTSPEAPTSITPSCDPDCMQAADSGAQSCTPPVHDVSLSTDTTATSSSPIRPLPHLHECNYYGGPFGIHQPANSEGYQSTSDHKPTVS